MNNAFSKPDFLVVGPAKTGTSWLYTQLSQLSGIKLAPVKEISFFNAVYFNYILAKQKNEPLNEFESRWLKHTAVSLGQAKRNFANRRHIGLAYALKAKWRLWAVFYFLLPRNVGLLSFKLYSMLFDFAGSNLTGDISPAYFTIGPAVIKLIDERFPKLKVVLILRDPVEREWSNIRMNYFHPDSRNTFSIEQYVTWYIPGADYISAINNWESQFGTERIQYLFYDDLEDSPHKFLSQFLKFIGSKTTDKAVNDKKVNAGIEKQIEPEIRKQLVRKNLPQYQFLAAKFGEGSYPAQWLEKALRELE